jgi:hypothetical protein
MEYEVYWLTAARVAGAYAMHEMDFSRMSRETGMVMWRPVASVKYGAEASRQAIDSILFYVVQDYLPDPDKPSPSFEAHMCMLEYAEKYTRFLFF